MDIWGDPKLIAGQRRKGRPYPIAPCGNETWSAITCEKSQKRALQSPLCFPIAFGAAVATDPRSATENENVRSAVSSTYGIRRRRPPRRAARTVRPIQRPDVMSAVCHGFNFQAGEVVPVRMVEWPQRVSCHGYLMLMTTKAACFAARKNTLFLIKPSRPRCRSSQLPS